MKRCAVPNSALGDLEILVIAIDGDGVGRVGLYFHGIGPRFFSRVDDLKRPPPVPQMVRRHLGNNIRRLPFADFTIVDRNCWRHLYSSTSSIRPTFLLKRKHTSCDPIAGAGAISEIGTKPSRLRSATHFSMSATV